MISFENYRTLETNTAINNVPEWYKSERYNYCESFFESRPLTKAKSFFGMILSFLIG